MSTNSRIEKINKVVNERNMKAQNEYTEVRNEHSSLCVKCAALARRIHELVAVANACIEGGIDIGQKFATRDKSIFGGKCRNDFMADGVHHTVGFYQKLHDGNTILGIGRKGGGCCCYDYIFIESTGKLVSDAHRHTFQRTETQAYINENELAKELLKDFDDFEARFYAFVDSL